MYSFFMIRPFKSDAGFFYLVLGCGLGVVKLTAVHAGTFLYGLIQAAHPDKQAMQPLALAIARH